MIKPGYLWTDFQHFLSDALKLCIRTDKKMLPNFEYADSLPCKIKNAADFYDIMHNLCAIFLLHDAF